jgi:predicted HicB family RNase H-like nuclease
MINQTLQHHGYDGSVEYSAEDKMLHGRVVGIRDMISFGGKSVRELEKNFRNAVDEYLEFCKKKGKTPNKPFKGSLSVRLRDGLHTKAAIFAEKNDVKINTVINDALDEYLAKSA